MQNRSAPDFVGDRLISTTFKNKQLMPVIKQQTPATTSTLLPKRITHAELVHKIEGLRD
ncbi:hypothetical protein [Tychonema sp. LEGE 06208]|uniref:hypothetical protein n=1 Tax=Tychonema sp. LEGE 06208 TaxID=1828663 RepID=UPI00187EA9C7|nr:hypothetical protein [Tychonema sp. LEGE 06208]MBE9165483.1 hypothetical protein [Tychonema sp. LEGE 06208]